MQEVTEWFRSNGFSIVKNEDRYFFVRNRLSIPIETASAMSDMQRWKLLWAADNWLAFALNENKEVALQIDNFLMDFRFVLDAPIDAVENIYFQNPDIKVH